MNNAKGLLCIDACVELRAPGRMSGAHDYSSGCTLRTDLGLYASSRGIVSMLMACMQAEIFQWLTNVIAKTIRVCCVLSAIRPALQLEACRPVAVLTLVLASM